MNNEFQKLAWERGAFFGGTYPNNRTDHIFNFYITNGIGIDHALYELSYLLDVFIELNEHIKIREEQNKLTNSYIPMHGIS